MKNEIHEQHAFGRRGLLRGGGTALAAFVAGATLGVRESLSGQIKLGFILPDYNQMRWKHGDLLGFQHAAERLGVSFLHLQSNDSETVQANQVEDMLLHGIDVLVITPVNGSAARAVVHKANAARVPVISYNFLALHSDISCFVGNDFVRAAETVAKLALEDHPKGNYVLACGDEGTSVAVAERQGFMNVLKPKIQSGDIKVVSDQYNKGWSTSLARSQVENALTKVNNDLAAVVCGNDGMAYGAIEALQAQGLTGKVFVNGFDCAPRAQHLIKKGVLTASSFTDFYQEGEEAAKAAYKLAKGRKVESKYTINNGLKTVPWIKCNHVLVTKSNLPEMVKRYPWWFDKSDL